MIRILYLHNMSQISGGERSLLGLWENLDRLRFELFLMLPSEGQLSRAAQHMGIKVSFLDVPQLHLKNVFSVFAAARELRQFLRSNQINIIHSYSPRNNILSSLVARFLGIKVIWHERNLLLSREPDRSRQFFSLPDRIICNSNAVAQRFAGKDLAKVRVVCNGVDLEKFKPAQGGGQLKTQWGLEGMKVAGMVTNLNTRKGIEFLIETAPLVVSKTTNVRFLIVGGEFPSENGARLKELRRKARDLGVEKYFVWTGFQEDVRPFLDLLDVLVHVTVKEACSRAILEAMACGKAVVAFNDGGNPELVEQGNTGFLTEVNEREELSAKVIELLMDDEKRLFLGQAARQRVELLFDVKTNARETQEIYLECQA